MKKVNYKLAALFAAATLCAGMVSCKDDDKKSDDFAGLDNPVNPVAPTSENAMSAEDQKEYLEKVALELMDQMPASEYEQVIEMADDWTQQLSSDQNDAHGITQWANQAVESMFEVLSLQDTTLREMRGKSYIDSHIVRSNRRALLSLSNFTGHFTLNDKEWEYAEANDLQFAFTDKSGRLCQLKLQTKGDTKSVKVVTEIDSDEYQELIIDEDGIRNYEITYVDDTALYVLQLPEQVILTLTCADMQVLKGTFTFDLSKIDGEQFDISKSAFDVSSSIELANGYKYEMCQFAYSGNAHATLSYRLSKNDKTLVAWGIATDVKGLPSAYADELLSSGFEDLELDKFNLTDVVVLVNVLGKVQLRGTISDYLAFTEAANSLENSDEESIELSDYKALVEKLNSKFNLGIFYDGNYVQQADFKFAVFAEDGDDDFEYVPVIKFGDQTTYGEIGSFFNEKSFANVIKAFGQLMEDYQALGK